MIEADGSVNEGWTLEQWMLWDRLERQTSLNVLAYEQVKAFHVMSWLARFPFDAAMLQNWCPRMDWLFDVYNPHE